jgi:hypothetical protein
MKFRKSLFWDTDVKKIKVKKNAKYIIERILDFGMDPEVRWMSKTYPKTLIRKVVKNSRVLRPKTKNLWQMILE